MNTDTNQRDSLEDAIDTQIAESDDTEEVAAEAVEDVSRETHEEPETVAEAIEALKPAPKWDKRYSEAFESWGAQNEDGTPVYANGREIQQIVLDMYNDEQKHNTQVSQERADLQRHLQQVQPFVQGIQGALSPYKDFITETGGTPDQYIRQGIGLLQQLWNHPAGTLTRLARDSNVDLQSALQGQEWKSPEAQQIEQTNREIQRMRQEQMQRDQRAASERMYQMRQANEHEINAFAEAVDESGNKLHPHLETVQDDMAQLIYGRNEQRKGNPSLPVMGLDEAYDRACRLSSEITEAKAKSAETARLAEAAAKARKASEASKRLRTGSTGQGKMNLNLDQQIEDAISKTA